MTSIKDNTIFDRTSFLEGSNSDFIEELYLKYVNNPETVPQSWREFFVGLNEDSQIIRTEIQGPSWAPKKITKLQKLIILYSKPFLSLLLLKKSLGVADPFELFIL